jgi:hypothetical protein
MQCHLNLGSACAKQVTEGLASSSRSFDDHIDREVWRVLDGCLSAIVRSAASEGEACISVNIVLTVDASSVT